MSLELKDQYDKVYKYCYFKVRDQHLAEDLTQETFLRFFSQHTYISRGKYMAYLYTIAKHLCIDVYREKAGELVKDDIPKIDRESAMEGIETHLMLENAMQVLPEELQEIILLRFINELSLSEIGRMTGSSRFSVYRKLNKALAQLKEIMEGRKENENKNRTNRGVQGATT